MIAAKKATSEGGRGGDGGATSTDASDGRGSKEVEPKGSGGESDEVGTGEEGMDEEWEQVGRKNKSTITRQVRVDHSFMYMYIHVVTCYARLHVH